ncbi:MAG: Response regulator receiver domain [Acetobacteraceae bacterium]|jgi:CheY-like chemotaxis protein|nr:Response regulator receiver domain [Acetobacteraceae bacterium]MEA2787990.1 Response regulator receiver domain [Acetobacteraceae bacterium]
MNMIATEVISRDYDFLGSMATAKQGVVAIISDDSATIQSLKPVCEFLELRMEVVSAGTDLATVLREMRPMAIIADIECKDYDGFYAMKVIASHSRDLPLMLLTGGDPVMMGAADAVQDVCGLTSVTLTSEFPVASQLVAFLFGAGRRSGCMRLVPV